MIGGRAGQVVTLVERRDGVVGIVGHDDVREHEATTGREAIGNVAEQVGLLACVEVVHGERGDDEIEGAFRELVLEARHAEIGGGHDLVARLRACRSLSSIPIDRAWG